MQSLIKVWVNSYIYIEYIKHKKDMRVPALQKLWAVGFESSKSST